MIVVSSEIFTRNKILLFECCNCYIRIYKKFNNFTTPSTKKIPKYVSFKMRFLYITCISVIYMITAHFCKQFFTRAISEHDVECKLSGNITVETNLF